MDTLTINEKNINIPTGWFDVTFDKFIKFNHLIKNLYEETEESEKEDDI